MPSRAVPLFEHVITLDPANAEAYYFLVFASNWAGEYETSIKAGETFLREFGDDPEVHLWMGSSFHALGKSKRALVHLEEALELGAMVNMYTSQLVGDVYDELGMEQEAMELWEAGAEELEGKLQKHPNQPQVRKFLASLYARLGKRAAFEREFSLATTVDFVPKYGAGPLGWLIKLGEHERALDLLVQAEEDGFYFGEKLPDYCDALKDLPGYKELAQRITKKHRRFLALY
jgi:tetratricopeptide (TPR) repeat protein